jgi:anthranilate synthase component I
MKLTTDRITTSADMHTPVGLYLLLRDIYPGTLLLESSDYHAASNSSSYICLNPLSSFSIRDGVVIIKEKDEIKSSRTASIETLLLQFDEFMNSFDFPDKQKNDGVFGYIAYDCISYFEDIELQKRVTADFQHPEMVFSLYRYVIHMNHFNDIMTLTEYIPKGEQGTLQNLTAQISRHHSNSFPFTTIGQSKSNISDESFMEMVRQAKQHCRRGDVFQMVLSRRYSVQYKGDDFNVYRALRRINPSPYLYYLDYGDFRIFGSSPESQLKISKGSAILNPIAGTYRRTGDDAADKALAEKLSHDPKENAEHAMLVDLARNDLSRSCRNVEVTTYKEVQYFSHVIHLVSKVTGQCRPGVAATRLVADTFPAGTLSGAPKHRAMQLIDQYEQQSRGFYGGAVGFISFDGEVNLAILIRSFLSRNNSLFFQAGAGIVDASDEALELQEVNNKLAALNKAIQEAQTKQ